MVNTFATLTIRNWRQFRSVKINIHPRATILTGANGSGKSTILGIFGQHLGFQRPIVGTPSRRVGGSWEYDAGFFDVTEEETKLDEPLLPFTQQLVQPGMPPQFIGTPPAYKDVGRVTYSNGIVAAINAPESSNAYGLNIQPMQHVPGLYIPSHRVIANYQQVTNLNLQVNQADIIYGTYINEINARYNGQHTGFSPVYRMKEAIVSLAAFGQGNDYLEGNDFLLQISREFEDALRVMLPDELGFQGYSVRLPDIVLNTIAGEFTLDASSGGISSLFELTWQILLFSKTSQGSQNFVVAMDEPENHLHPSMQRTLLPKLLKAFPQVQFLVASHSPFIVSSLESSNVYALRYRSVALSGKARPLAKANRVEAVQLARFTKAGSASDILREVLGVPVTFPDWANERVADIVASVSGAKLDRAAISSLRARLVEAGLEEYYPQALEELVADR